MDDLSPSPGEAEEVTQRWIADFVIKHSLCPFAKREVVNQSIRIKSYLGVDDQNRLQAIEAELTLIRNEPNIETTLVVFPHALHDFSEFLNFIETAGKLIALMELENEFQIASFHPKYQFIDTEIHAPENFTNRSPFPVLHILREISVENAVRSHSGTENIPESNKRRMNQIGLLSLKKQLNDIWPLGFERD